MTALPGNPDDADADVSEWPGFTMQWAKGSGNAAVSRIGPCGPCLQFLPENGFTRGTTEIAAPANLTDQNIEHVAQVEREVIGLQRLTCLVVISKV